MTHAVFIIACWVVVAATIARAPRDSAIGLGILGAGLVVYLVWRRRTLS